MASQDPVLLRSLVEVAVPWCVVHAFHDGFSVARLSNLLISFVSQRSNSEFQLAGFRGYHTFYP